MLKKLKIRNYLLIDHLELEFPDDFITITGETGAGKSVFIGAISLLTGKRADTSVLLDKTLKSVVEAVFLVDRLDLRDFFEKNELDYDDECILRREISGSGKSRAFINDTPVKLDQLQELSSHLIDIHSQHQTLNLSLQNFQRNILDSVSDLGRDLADYQQLYEEYKSYSKEFIQLNQVRKAALEEKDFLEFQFNQLEEAALLENEQNDLFQQEKILSNAEEIKSALFSVVDTLGNESSVLDAMTDVQRKLDQINVHFSIASDLSERIESVRIELKDIIDTCEQEAETVEYDPEKLVQVQDRINLINSLLQKHQKETISELIDLKNELGKKLMQISLDDSRVNELERLTSRSLDACKRKAKILSHKRLCAVPVLKMKLQDMLSQLGMPHSVFEIKISEIELPDSFGLDRIHFLFSANPDIEPQEIHKVASGGEMSRLMLCLKSIVAEYQNLPSIVFDEIDTGVSGEIAGKMGEMMKCFSGKSQVICITHLPQVAAQGSKQLHVKKETKQNQTRINITCLNYDERIFEIARMTSGKDISEIALQHAKDLLAN